MMDSTLKLEESLLNMKAENDKLTLEVANRKQIIDEQERQKERVENLQQDLKRKVQQL